MGTRGLTCVVQDGEYKVAQYGQWDHYPSGQGMTIAEFLVGTDLEAFAQKVRKVKTYANGDEAVAALGVRDWGQAIDKHPHLSRDTGGKILDYVLGAEDPFVVSSLDFAGDSLFCEYAYVVDLDKQTFEVYKGFNTEPLAEGERFAFADKPGEYRPVRFLISFDLGSLTIEAYQDFVDPSQRSWLTDGQC